MVKRILKWFGIGLLSLISALLIVILILACLEKVIYRDFFDRSIEVLDIYGLETSYVPQGLTYSRDKKVYLTSGYMNDGGPSRVYYIQNSQAKYVELENEDGTAFYGHVGGISVSGDHVYIASDDRIYHTSFAAIESCEEGNPVRIDYTKELDLVPAFTTVKDGILYVGEFYKKGAYDTAETHHVKTPSGETNHAMCYAFGLDESGNTDWNPLFALTLPEKVQGLAVTDSGKYVLSTSWSIASSALKIYEFDTSETEETYAVEGKKVPLYHLCEDHRIDKVSLPPMSEELEYVDGRVLVNFESAGAKYKNFNIYRQKKIWGYALD